MGVLDRFEKRVERAVNGAFAKAFRSEVQPVEIASALRREIDDKASIVGRDRTIVPNDFVVELGKADHSRLEEWQAALADELSAAVTEHASNQRYAFVGPVRIQIEEAEDLDTGLFRVRSHTVRPAGEPAQEAAPPARPAPAAAPVVSAPPGAAAAPGPPFGSPAVSDHPPAWARTSAPTPAASQPTATIDVDGRTYPLSAPVTVIGRSTEADIVLDDPGVSRRHAEIHLVDGRARVIDLGSTNGTFVDGERVHAGSLTDGSVVTIGRSKLTFRSSAGGGYPDGYTAGSW